MHWILFYGLILKIYSTLQNVRWILGLLFDNAAKICRIYETYVTWKPHKNALLFYLCNKKCKQQLK